MSKFSSNTFLTRRSPYVELGCLTHSSEVAAILAYSQRTLAVSSELPTIRELCHTGVLIRVTDRGRGTGCPTS